MRIAAHWWQLVLNALGINKSYSIVPSLSGKIDASLKSCNCALIEQVSEVSEIQGNIL